MKTARPNLPDAPPDNQDVAALVAMLGRTAKASSSLLPHIPEERVQAALHGLAEALRGRSAEILSINARDIKAAEQNGLTPALIDRLTLTPERVEAMANSVEVIAALENPVGKILSRTQRPNGLVIERVACPIGVLGIIYESRPNVTVDAAALSLKSRNAVILRGGSESYETALFLYEILKSALKEQGIPEGAVCFVETKDREAVGAMLALPQYIDAIIPRGGKSLTSRVMADAKMPVFAHLDGICHIYVHESAKPDLAAAVTLNAKMRRTGICGAMETLLLDTKLKPETARAILTNLLDAGCEIVGDKMVQGLDPRIAPAKSEDWGTEYLDAKLSVAAVNGIEEAVRHINTYGSHHTDSILCEDDAARDYFLSHVESAIVMHNASTQFADGGEFGMGAEIGIATGKMHARGPVGVEQLCTYKYIVRGSGQVRP
jgi:glutamate-5-semialdehyde dehydrogenase